MLDRINLKNILVLDIETVPQYAAYDELPVEWKELWKKKMARDIKEGLTPDGLYQRAGIYAEFGKIICICAGYFFENGTGLQFKVKAFYGDDEKKLLEEFSEALNKSFSTDEHLLCGHNSKEFDFPYIARRCLINGLPIPYLLDNAGKKPWEVQLIDTMDMWKFGDYKHFTSLKLLTKILGVPSPKGDIDGSQVAHVFYVEKDIDRIVTYCEKDTIAVAQIFLRLRREDLLIDDEIIHV